MQKKTAFLGASALALAAWAAAPAAAQAPATTVFAGGGTAPAKLLRDVFNCYSAKSYGIYGSSLDNPASASYPAGLNAKCTTNQGNSVAFAYDPVASGAVIKAFTTGSASALGIPTSSNVVAYLNGSATVGASAAPYPAIVFAASDAYLSTSQIAAAGTVDAPSGSSNAIFTIASFGSPITLPIGQVNGVNLTLANVCDIFSGQARVPGNTAATQTLFYRADGGGSSALFGLWLLQNCTGKGAQGIAYAFTAANGFGTTSPTWSNAFVGSLATPSGVSGSGGMANAVAGSKYSIGYVSPDYDYPVVASSQAYAAKINGFTSSVANVTTHLKAVAIPATYVNTIGQTLATEATAPALSTSGYPIAGFSFVFTYGCYSSTYAGGQIGSNAQGNLLKSFLTTLYSNTVFSSESTAIINASGYAAPPVALIALYKSAGGPLSTTGINGTQCPSGRT